MLKATASIPGIREYYIPDEWTDIYAVYLIPSQFITKAFRRKREALYQKYKVDFVVQAPNPNDKINNLQRKLIIEKTPDETMALVVSCTDQKKVKLSI